MKKNTKTILSSKIKGNGNFQVSFPLPDDLKHVGISINNIDRSIQSYLLARYAFIHRMQNSFMINSFWAVEHAILSILVLKWKTKEELFKNKMFEYHKITQFWTEAKLILEIDEINEFDDYIGVVQSYFSERYPEKNNAKLIQSTSKAQVFIHENNEENTEKKLIKSFSKTYRLDINELDKFFKYFILHYSNYGSGNFGEKLASYKSIELYKKQNNHLIIAF